jgi:GDP-4-dehydro-6-deoxy-D-mannose reductase
VCSGTAHSGWEILDALCKAMQRPKPSTVMGQRRSLDPSIVAGNSARLRAETGWKPLLPLEASIKDFVTTAGGPVTSRADTPPDHYQGRR